MAVRWMAGGSYLDSMTMFGISREAFFVSLWTTLLAIVDTHKIEFSMTQAACADTAAGFLARQRHPVFRGVVGAVDGILIKIWCPSEGEYPKPAQFYTRKGYYALNVQAVVDARR
eukprot:3936662-Rhodomonas_salina.1